MGIFGVQSKMVNLPQYPLFIKLCVGEHSVLWDLVRFQQLTLQVCPVLDSSEIGAESHT